MPAEVLLAVVLDQSGSLWEQDHRALNRLLPAFDRLVHKAVDAAGGRLLSQPGDSAVALLPAPQAVGCALGLFKAIAAADWSPFKQFNAGIGISPELDDALARCEQLARAAGPGGLLLGADALALCSLPAGLQPEAVGPGLFRLASGGPAAPVLPLPLALGGSALPIPHRPPLREGTSDAVEEATALLREAQRHGRDGDSVAQSALAKAAQERWLALGDAVGAAWSLYEEAQALLRQGKLALAAETARRCQEQALKAADVEQQMRAWLLVAEAEEAQGLAEPAREAAHACLRLARRYGATWAEADACAQLAAIAELQSAYRESRHYLARAHGLAVSLGPQSLRAFNLQNLLAQVEIALGRYKDAEALLERSLDPRCAPEGARALDWPLNLKAQLLVVQGRFDQAQAVAEAGLTVGSGAWDVGSWFKENLAAALIAQGQTSRALELSLQSLHAAESSGRLRGVAWSENRLGQLELGAGRYDEARARLLRARDLHAQLGEPQGLASDELALAKLERLQGDPVKAAAIVESVVSAYHGFCMPRGIALAHLELGSCFMAQEELSLAFEPMAVSLRLSASIQAWPVFCRALLRLAELRIKEGQEELGVQALACLLQQSSCEAETEQGSRALLAALRERIEESQFEPWVQRGGMLRLSEAAVKLGVEIPVSI